MESKVGYSLFIKRFAHSVIYVLVYMDDIISKGSSQQEVKYLSDNNVREFFIKDLGILHVFFFKLRFTILSMTFYSNKNIFMISWSKPK